MQPKGKCLTESQEPDLKTKWDSGSSFDCTIDAKGKGATCTGSGPDGKPCMVFTVTTNPDDSATGKLVINGQTYGMEFADKGAITVTCANGKVEKYAVEKDLCAPLELDECEKGGNGGGPICAPLFSCGPNDTCPVGYTCEPALSACLKQCAPGGPCPACQTCSKSDNLCHPGSGPPPP